MQPWLLKEADFSNPYNIIRAKTEIFDDQETKRSFWNPSLKKRFKGHEDPNYIVIKSVSPVIEYYYGGKQIFGKVMEG